MKATYRQIQDAILALAGGEAVYEGLGVWVGVDRDGCCCWDRVSEALCALELALEERFPYGPP